MNLPNLSALRFAGKSYASVTAKLTPQLAAQIAAAEKDIFQKNGNSAVGLVECGTGNYKTEKTSPPGTYSFGSNISWIATGEDALFLKALKQVAAQLTGWDQYLVNELHQNWLGTQLGLYEAENHEH